MLVLKCRIYTLRQFPLAPPPLGDGEGRSGASLHGLGQSASDLAGGGRIAV